MKILTLLFALMLSLYAPTASNAQTPDQQAIEQVIRQQLQAFAADNGAEAFDYAAPLIQNMFGDPDNFIAMVKKGYPPVYRNKSYTFEKLATDSAGRPAQHVTIVTADGKTYTAVYTMEQQPDGSWKISGCYLAQITSGTV